MNYNIQIINSLKNNYIPWRNQGCGEHKNAFFDFNLLDQILLNDFSLRNNFKSNIWFTDDQIEKMGYRFDYDYPCKYLEKNNNILKLYNKDLITSSDDCDNNNYDNNKIMLDNLIHSISKLVLIKDSAFCCYRAGENIIHCIAKKYFINDIAYYDTILHEICHWAQVQLQIRFNYEFSNIKELKSFDEFLAESTSSFVLSKLNLCCLPCEVPYRANVDNYLEYWIKNLELHPDFLIQSLNYSIKIINFLFSKEVNQ